MKKTVHIAEAVLLGLFTADGLMNMALTTWAEYAYSEQLEGTIDNIIVPLLTVVLWVLFSVLFFEMLKHYKKSLEQ